MSCRKKMLEKINHLRHGDVFTACDFLELGRYDNVRKSLFRLAEYGYINKIMDGMYFKPTIAERGNGFSYPQIEKVAIAIARKNNWTIAPSGNTALNLLGLSTQVPLVHIYASSGRSVQYMIGGVTIQFQHVNSGELYKGIPETTALIIQAVKTIGRGRMDDSEIVLLREKLPEKERKNLLKHGRGTSAWVYEILRKIAGEIR